MEATGLWLLKRWGEYFAVIATSLGIPIEVYELTEKITWVRIGALVINIAAVLYILLSKRLFGLRGGHQAYEAERHEASLLEVGWGLQKRLAAEAVLVTRGAEGMSLFERGGRYTHLPTVAREVFDVTGAGDTVVSVVALALAAGADFPRACQLANHAAGVVIREVGTATCSPAELLESLDGPRS